MRRRAETGSTIVVKIGSSSLAEAGGGLSESAVERVVDQVTTLRSAGHPVVLVTSGAVAAGLPELGLERPPADLPTLQTAAAVGQGRLMEAYGTQFSRRGLVSGQVLLTKDVLADRNQYLHAREAMERMLALGVVPVVNENDTVVVDELKFGDNDRLAAIVTFLVGAGLLVILTDTAGLFTEDPQLAPDAALLDVVRHTDAILDRLVTSRGKGVLGSGGVATKVVAAQMAAFGGTPTVVAPSSDRDGAVRAAAGDAVGTWVEPRPDRLNARKAWIAFGVPATGSVGVDEGAVTALAARGRSLLPAGVTTVTGAFTAGDAVEILGPSGALVAKGLTRMGDAELRAAAGRHSSEAGGEVVHRDDLVVLRPADGG